MTPRGKWIDRFVKIPPDERVPQAINMLVEQEKLTHRVVALGWLLVKDWEQGKPSSKETWELFTKVLNFVENSEASP